ncbi:uncharacterized protein LOC120041697 [Salvelinus namaycush]|uniref:Uncharacterized protein LOC120041697 n=1 Tax=Salvelinus namaycush TaxID=8040 RepID=A0A8U0U7G2_SALNM|nr:uncharacterized protein LOC120041697 [Salvelinus namaycush]
MFVDIHKDHLIQNVTMVIPIAFYLIRSEKYSEIHAARTSQDQMGLLYEALDYGGKQEEKESGGKMLKEGRVKSDFYRILLDLEPDLVIDLDDLQNLSRQLEIVHRRRRPKDSDEEDLYLDELIQNLPDQLEKIREQRDELKEKLRKAEETIQSLSTSPGGQQKTQTPSQNESEIEEMEMKTLPGSGRKSAPEKKPLLAAGPQKDDLDELERGGRVTIDNNYML